MDIKTLRLLSFRYALGRASYIVAEVVEELITNWDDMHPYQEQIQKDIQRAIDTDSAGMRMDAKEWMKILELDISHE